MYLLCAMHKDMVFAASGGEFAHRDQYFASLCEIVGFYSALIYRKANLRMSGKNLISASKPDL
jgi:hypothetical protein